MATLLVTGFGPFGDVDRNPSQALLALLPDRVRGHRLVTAVLPVDTLTVPSLLGGLALLGPRLVVLTGVAVGRPVLSFERTATNWLEFPRPDRSGRLPEPQPIFPGAPATRPTRLPERETLAAWSRAGLPHEPSESAGTYLCNQVFYTALAAFPANVPVGFVHVPADEALGATLGVPSLPLDRIARGVLAAVESALATV